MRKLFTGPLDVFVYALAVVFVAASAIAIHNHRQHQEDTVMNDQVNNAALPTDGFEPVLSPMDFPKYEFKIGESIVARVADKTSHNFGTEDDPDHTRILIIEVGDVKYTVYESAGLSELMKNAMPGDWIKIERTEDRKVPGKPSPMKCYKVGIKRV